MNRFLNDVRKYYDYEVRAAKSELKTEVADSFLNWIWWVLDPLFTMSIYYVVFGHIFKSKEPNFTIFLFIGLTMWGFFSRNVQQSVKLVKKNKSIIAKVYIPKFVLLFTNMMVVGFKMLISWCIVILMMIVFRVQISLYVFAFFPIMLVLVIVTFGFSMIMLHFGVFIEDLSNVVSLLFKLLYYATGIFYSIQNRVGPDHPLAAKLLYNCNPMALLITDMRNVLIYQTGPNWKGLVAWTLIGLVLSVIGVKVMYKNENSYVKVI